MTNEEILAKVAKALEKEPWINPEWPPLKLCAEDEKQDLIHFVNIIAALWPKSLGATEIIWEKVPILNGLLLFNDGDDKDFLENALDKQEGDA